MIHQAFFWLKDPADVAARDALVAGVRTLAAIPQVQRLRIFLPADTEARDVVETGWAVHEHMEFASLADQAAYQPHPLHVAFIENCGHLWDKVVVYDGEEV